MLLATLVTTSRAVAATRSRNAKRDLIAELLRAVESTEIEIKIATAYLSGVLLQRRTGIGWRALQDLPEPAPVPSVAIDEVNARLDEWATLAGPGSVAARHDGVQDLFGRLTAEEQEFLRAVMTGNIRQGALDSVMLEAIAVAAEVPIESVRRAAMFSAETGPIASAALLGGEPALAAFTLQVGRPIRPMLASSAAGIGEAIPQSPDYFVVDTKLDGIRIQVHKDADDVAVFTRSLEEISARLPHVVSATRALPASRMILDGEALSIDELGQPRAFQDTASRMASRDSPVDHAVHPFFFDLLLLDGEMLMDSPAEQRLAALDAAVPSNLRTPRLMTNDATAAQAFFNNAISAGHEGVVLKSLDAPYESGRRGSGWIKVKPRHTLDLVVLAVEWGSGRRGGLLSNIHLGARDGDGFVMLGKTFKGMTDAMLTWQTERFLQLETFREGHVVHLRPEQVVEVAFDGVQRSSRYPGGVALRFARVLRYRDDKTAKEADTLRSVRAFNR